MNKQANLEKLLKEYLGLPELSKPISTALSDYKMTTLGKLIFASLLVTMSTGKKSPFKLSGDQKKIDILARVVQSSKNFQEEIKRPGATVDSVIRAMDMKNIDAKNFKSEFGADWPL
jgi:hypothetical protein